MIYDDYKTISGSATIYGYKNSTAQQYAGNYNRKFKVIEDKEQLGDVNGDGIISILDATNIQKQLVGLYDFTNEQRRNADVNGDGVINVLDARSKGRGYTQSCLFTPIFSQTSEIKSTGLHSCQKG